MVQSTGGGWIYDGIFLDRPQDEKSRVPPQPVANEKPVPPPEPEAEVAQKDEALPFINLPERLEELERQLITEAYERSGRVKTVTARMLGIKPSTLYYKLEKYGFHEVEREKGSYSHSHSQSPNPLSGAQVKTKPA